MTITITITIIIKGNNILVKNKEKKGDLKLKCN